MDFKLVSKNNMGIVGILILVVLLSQCHFFDFLTETSLGRIVLLILVIIVAYTNKILGLLAVLFVIIAFNNNDMKFVHSYNFYEGFDVSGNVQDASGNAAVGAIIQDKIQINQAKQNILQNQLTALQQKQQQANNLSQTATTTSSAATTTTPSGTEGFCMSDRETNILRGKQSNTVPVFNNSRHQDDDVSPSDKSVFTDSYASF